LKHSEKDAKKAHSIYDPLRQQFLNLIKCLDILKAKKNSPSYQEIFLLSQLINTALKQCDIYLNFKLTKIGK
jgi:hypothetical protein